MMPAMRVAVTVLVLASCDFSGPAAAPQGTSDADVDRDATVIDTPVTTLDAPLDSPELAPCPAPAAGCTLFECAGTSNCFYACSTPRNHTDAAVRCEQDGMGCLATISNATENTCVAQSIQPPPIFPALITIGYEQAPNGSEPDGGWAWRCGSSAFVAPNWGDFEPTNTGGNEDCAGMNEGGAWIDVDCGVQFRYICELPR
jgi:hypothetical protein